MALTKGIANQMVQWVRRVFVDSSGVNILGVVLVDENGNQVPPVSAALPTVLYNGNKTVAAAGTAEALAASQALISGVRVKALEANTGQVYVGDSSVDSANGFQLSSGESVFLEIANLATVHVDSAVNGEGVSFVGS